MIWLEEGLFSTYHHLSRWKLVRIKPEIAGRTKEISTSAGTTTFTYDHESRAVTLTGPGMAQTNVYNGLDTRVGSTTNSVANTYLRNGAYVTAPVIKDSSATFTPGVSERREPPPRSHTRGSKWSTSSPICLKQDEKCC